MIIGGLLVDKLPNLISFLIAAGLALVGFAGVAWSASGDFETLHQLVCVLCQFIAGIACSIATICSVVTALKNFDREVAVLMAAIFVTYMKTAQAFDDAIQGAFLPEADTTVYIIVIGVICFVVFLIGAFTMRKVDCGKVIDMVSKQADPTGALVFIIVCGLYIFVYWVLVRLLNLYGIGAGIILFFLVLNFLMLGLAVYLIFLKIKGAKGLGGGLSLKKPDEVTLAEALKDKVYLFTCFSAMCVMGTGYSYQAAQVLIVLEAEALDALGTADDAFWLADALARFGGGCIGFFLAEKVNKYLLLLIFSICAMLGDFGVCAILAADIDGGFVTFIPAVFIGLGVGGYWVIIAQIIVEEIGLDNYGSCWGMAITFNIIAIVLFDTLVDLFGFGLVIGILYAIFGILAVVFCFLAKAAYDKNKK